MRNPISVLVVIAAGCIPAQAGRFVDESSGGFTAVGDFDGDGLEDVVFLDKQTGSYRIGFGQSNGYYDFSLNALASGIAPVSGMGVGSLDLTTRDSLAVCSPDANRIHFLSPTNPVYVPPVVTYSKNSGPTTLAALDIPGSSNTAHDDLQVGSIYGTPGSPFMAETIFNKGNSTNFYGERAVSLHPDSMNPIVLKPGGAEFAGYILRNPGSGAIFQLDEPTETGPLAHANIGGQTDFIEWTYSVFDQASALLIFFEPGSPSVDVSQTAETTPGDFVLGALQNFVFGGNVRSITALRGSAPAKILVVYEPGDSADIMTYTQAGGFQILQSLDPAELDMGIEAVAANSIGDFVIFTSDSVGGGAVKYHHYLFGSGVYKEKDAGQLSPSPEMPLTANLFAFTGNPFVDPSERSLGSRNVLDWTTGDGFSTVDALSFVSPGTGLANKQTLGTGNAPLGTNYELVNQYHTSISLYSFETTLGNTPDAVEISPAPGVYEEAVSVTLTPTNPTHSVFYRTSPNQAFQLYAGSFWVFADTEISYYSRRLSAQAPIASARYLFVQDPAKLDSDDDGVPDFVELENELDPTGSLVPGGEPSDYDGDGFSDLEEILDMKDPADPNDFPASHQPGLDTLVLDITVLGFDGFANNNVPVASGTPIRVYDTEGRLLSSGETGGGGAASNEASVVVHPVDNSMRLLTVATDFHFDLVTSRFDKSIGRELVAAVQIPSPPPIEIEFEYLPNDQPTSVSNWLAAAISAHATPTPLPVTLEWKETVRVVLLERFFGAALGFLSIPEISLTPFRPNEDSGGQFYAPTSEDFLKIEQPADPLNAGLDQAYLLDTLWTRTDQILAAPGSGFAELLDISRDVYEISSERNNANPGTYAMPLDVIRQLTSMGGGVPTAYDLLLNRPFDDYIAVSEAFNDISSQMPQRPFAAFDLKMPAGGSPGVPLATSIDGSTTYALFDRFGDPFEMPETFALIPGSCFRVEAYTDLPDSDGHQSLAVLRSDLLTIPIATAADLDGNLLPDSWELFFFGATGQDWKSSPDGSGISLLQQFLDGSDPTDPTDAAPVAVELMMTNVELGAGVGEDLQFTWEWPQQYAEFFEFGVVESSDLEGYTETPADVTDKGDGTFCATVPEDSEARRRFMKVFVRLR